MTNVPTQPVIWNGLSNGRYAVGYPPPTSAHTMPYLAKLAARVSASYLLVLALGALTTSAAQVSQRVTVVVPEVEQLQTSGGEVTLAFQTPAQGERFADVVDNSGTYALSVNTAGNKVTGVLDGTFAAGVTVSVALDAPAGATSLGPVPLATTPRDLVNDVSNVSARGLGMTYIASADETAQPNGAGQTQTVTYTITDQ